MDHLSVRVGTLPLKNPIICGSGEHTIEHQGIRQAIEHGAAAVVAKSINESQAAKAQLDKTDYALLDASWQRLPWNHQPPADATLFCRSGLVQSEFEPWLESLCKLDRVAQSHDSYVVASLILSDLDACIAQAQAIEASGLRVLEVNIGAPHASLAVPGAITLERNPSHIALIVSQLRAHLKMPLWIKLTGQSEDVVSMAQAAKNSGADSVVMMGRFLGFLPDLDDMRPVLGTSAAIGGAWSLPLTARWLMLTRQAIGSDYPLIATNGARSGFDVARFLLAGAVATQMSSAVWTRGYEALSESIHELETYLGRKGQTATQILGQAADHVQSYQSQQDRPGHWKTFLKN
jgi:dihydroorotate dehydrogenase